MANPLTGDFEAVLQVSGGTVNRLLASMHQNAGANPDTPTFPHSISLRVGDPDPIEGLQGHVMAQIGVPRIELIHGVQDRFRLEVRVRARYIPDPGTEPLPEFIFGTVRAEYRLENVDPACPGWKTIASEYVWPRVIESTVTFEGTARDDDTILSAALVGNPSEINSRIAALIAVLLATRFEATPQKVSERFRAGSMRSLNVPVGGSAVAVPVSLAGGVPTGQITSIENVLLEGADFALGVTQDAIVARINETLEEFRASFSRQLRFYHRTYLDLGWFGDADLVEIDITWRITLTNAWAEWLGPVPLVGPSSGFVSIKASGQARTQKSEFNVDFDVSQLVSLAFDAGSQSLVVTPVGAATVDVHLGGILSALEGIVEGHVSGFIDPAIKGSLSGFAGGLPLAAQRAELSKQLKKMDAAAEAHFQHGVFTVDGMILRGRVTVAPRRPPRAEFGIAYAKDAFSGFASWIPGGQIDELVWSWTWWNGARPGGSETWDDRYLLRRPSAQDFTSFGLALALERPLPGLDGRGRVCLEVRGKQVDPATGELEFVQSGFECTRFGLDFAVAVERPHGRLFVREYAVVAPPDRPPRPDDPLHEVGLVEVASRRPYAEAANTLIAYLDDPADEGTIRALGHGLELCRRVDAGLLVLLLVPDGALAAQPQLLMQLNEQTSGFHAPTLVNEDVRGGWSSTFGLQTGSGEPGWRLVGPTGSLVWQHDGRLGDENLAVTLDEYLFPSHPAAVSYVTPGLDLGIRVPPSFLDPSLGGLYLRPCPPPPLGSLGLVTKIAFVQPGSEASSTSLAGLGARGEAGDGLLVVVADGADEEHANSLRDQLGGDVVAIPDPAGVIADRFGIGLWPTTLTLDPRGVVTSRQSGVEPTERTPAEPEAEQS